MDPGKLWAKSKREDEPDDRPSRHLGQHLADAYEAARRVLDATVADQLAALGLGDEYRDRLRRCVLLAAAVHDLGKANDHFQGMIRRSKDRQDRPQGVRHEWVTILILRELRAWLLPAVGGSEVDFAVVEWAVAGHHPGHDRQSPPRLCPPGAGPTIKVMSDHAEFPEVLAEVGKALKLTSDPPAVSAEARPLTGGANVFHDFTRWAKEARRTWEEFGPADRRLVAAVKNTLVAADVAGSALPREIADESKRWDAIKTSFDRKPVPDDLDVIVRYGLDGHPPREFQTAVAASSERVTFVKAGCGTGKTLAAYMWARDQHPGRRLYFCYPTTGTTTEGFRDYLHPPVVDPDTKKTDPLAERVRKIGADLFHSRAAVDFEIILGTGGDSKDADRDAAARAESLDNWATPIVACTVDAVLGLVQNNKRGLFGWPALAGAAFVFDEVHAYDDRLFGALLRFLRDVPGVPALLMTASLPDARQAALANTVRDAHRIELVPIAGPKGLEELPRYHKLEVADDDPLAEVRKALDNKQKVLWVCNTVGRVMDAAGRAADLGPLIYHSRFKYKDRVERHRDVIAAFNGNGPALAICSQVAEMSLDLSADLLVTDRATFPAIIQRLGRLNRRASQKTDSTKPFIVVVPDNHLPYTADDLVACQTWLGKLPAEGISQRHLAEAWQQKADDHPPDLVPSAWLDGGPATTVAELREASPGITVLMDEDVDKVRADRKSLGKYVLPMPPPPRSLNWRGWDRERGLPIAPDGTIDYDPNRGAEWRKS